MSNASPSHPRACAVARCRIEALAAMTTLEIGDEQVEVDLCPFHATDLATQLAWLNDPSRCDDEMPVPLTPAGRGNSE